MLRYPYPGEKNKSSFELFFEQKKRNKSHMTLFARVHPMLIASNVRAGLLTFYFALT